MPRVPMLNGPQVKERGVPSARLTAAPTAESLGAGVGVAVGNSARVANGIRVEEEGKADEQALFEARRRLNDWERSRIHDAKSGAAQLRGDQAFDLPAKLDEDYGKTREEIRGTLTPRQQQQFDGMAEQRRSSVLEWANKHEAGERERFYDEQTEADVESSKERVALDPDVADSEIRIMSNRRISRLRDKGLPTEAIQQQVQADETDAHGRVIGSLIAKGDDQGAEAYYTKARDRMEPKAREKYDVVVAETSRLGKVQRLSETVEDDIASGKILDETQAVRVARELAGDDPKIRDAAASRARDAWNLNERAKKDSLDRQFMAGNALLETSVGDIDMVQRELGQTWYAMDQTQRDAMRANAHRLKMKEAPKTDDRVYLSFPGDPREIVKISEADLLSKFKPNLNDRDWSEIRKRWKDAKDAEQDGTLTKNPKLQAHTSFEEDIKAAAMGTIIPVNKDMKNWTDNQVRDYAQFERAAAEAVEAAEVINKGPLDGKSRRKIIDDLRIKKVFVDIPWGRDRELPMAILTDEQTKAAYVPIKAIPAEHAERIRNLGVSYGNGKPDDDRVQRAYAAALRGDDAMVEAILGGQ